MNIDRRKFLSQSLAASAGLAGLPSLAGGRPSKEKYRVGIIGLRPHGAILRRGLSGPA